jgi:glycine/D-amino acid oxidase-like deaminating enzyme
VSTTIIVGAGITGASLAYHLALRGHETVLLDSDLPGSGATRASFAWIGRPSTTALPSAPLRYLALDEYRRLEQELPHLAIRWSGALTWGALAEAGHTIHPSQVTALEPNLIDPPAGANFQREDAAFDPTVVTDQLVDAAVTNGAQLHVGTPVIGLERRGHTVTGVQTAQGLMPATTVVLAAGNGAVPLCRSIGLALPVAPSPAVLVRLHTTPDLVHRIVARPDLEVRQQPDGTVLVVTEYRGETSRSALADVARASRQRVMESFRIREPVDVVSAQIGWRPMPEDGEPIIGAEPDVPGLYIAVLHSAITLAAAVGRLASDEITTGIEAPELAGCRRMRFDRATSWTPAADVLDQHQP